MRIRRNSNKTHTAPTSNVYSSDNSLLALDVIQRPVHGSKDLSPLSRWTSTLAATVYRFDASRGRHFVRGVNSVTMATMQHPKGGTMKRLLIVVLLVLVTCPAFAKPKEKIYQATCDKVWAAVKIATAPPHYNFAQLDDAQKKGMISTGNNFSGKRYLDITLVGNENTCTVQVGGSYSGLEHNDKGDLFKRIDDALAQAAAAPATTPAATPKN
jgi:hypothetical protein